MKGLPYGQTWRYVIPPIVPFTRNITKLYSHSTTRRLLRIVISSPEVVEVSVIGRSRRSSQSRSAGQPMSARQNKKPRKNRNNANNRERTVTTLTENPNTPYLVPTPSEEPAGGHIAAHFSPTAANKLTNVPMGSQPYQMSQNFASFVYSGGFASPISNLQSQQQQQTFYQTQSQSQLNMQQQGQESQPIPPLPSGKDDLEILQNLKRLIIENQHPFFRAVPQPVALARLYKGSLISTSLHQEQQNDAESQNETAASTIDPNLNLKGIASVQQQSRMESKENASLSAASNVSF